jgi:hypothetical protein
MALVGIVLGIVVLLIGGTAFAAWRSDRAAERDEAEPESEG